MTSAVVETIHASGGKIVVVKENHGTIILSDGRTLERRFVGVPLLRQDLFGRDAELTSLRAQLCREASRVALSAVAGLPGVGKTTLAQALACDAEVATHFGGGVFWASLGPRAQVLSALDLWCTALGIEVREANEPLARARLVAAALQKQAQGKPVLLILDDVWELEVLEPFRAVPFPGCAMLLTTRDAAIARRFSREPTEVQAFSKEAAEAFLAAECPKAKEADPENLRALAGATGGLPLGLALIAAALRDKSGQARWVQEEMRALEAVERRLALVTDETRPGLEGVPNTLRAIVEMSVERLEPALQEAFTALGAFAPQPADFGREAVLAVCGLAEAQGDVALQRLCDLHLLTIVGEERFALHQVLGAVAEVRQGEGRVAKERHAAYYLACADNDPEDWRRIDRELEQIRRGWAWIAQASGKDEQVLAYTDALIIFFIRRGLRREHLAWLERRLDAARALRRLGEEAATLGNMGNVHSATGDQSKALEFYEQVLPLQREVGDREGEATTLNNMGNVHSDLGDKSKALGFYEQALPLQRKMGNREGEARTLNNMGVVYSDLGDQSKALGFYEQALPLQRKVGDRAGEARTLANMGGMHRALGDKSKALELLEQALTLWREVGDRPGEARTLNNMGLMHEDLGDKSKALEFYNEALPLLREVGDREGEAMTRLNIARVLYEAGRTDEAIAFLEQAVVIDETIQHPDLDAHPAMLARLRAKHRVRPARWLLLSFFVLAAALGWLLCSR